MPNKTLPGIEVARVDNPMPKTLETALASLTAEHKRVVDDVIQEMNDQFHRVKSVVRRLYSEGVVDQDVLRKRLNALNLHIDIEPIIDAMGSGGPDRVPPAGRLC